MLYLQLEVSQGMSRPHSLLHFRGIEEEDVLVELGGMHGVHLFTCVGACTFMQMFISTPRVFVPDACV